MLGGHNQANKHTHTHAQCSVGLTQGCPQHKISTPKNQWSN